MLNQPFEITTLGCKVNTYDTSLLEQRLAAKGLIPKVPETESTPYIHIINSCAVTEKSSLETHRMVKKIKAKNPKATVVVTGCVAQVDVDRLRNLTGADLIIGNSHKTQLEQIIESYLTGQSKERVFHSNIFKKEELEEGGGIESSKTRAFLKIQDGCNSFCSFCIIPFARGKSRSIPVDRLVQRVRELHLKGFKEVILTGVHIGDYEDGDLRLSDLVEQILKTPIARVRLSSLEPIEIDDKLFSLFRDFDKLCPHFHMSIQSANTKVLKDMKRNYGQKEIEVFFNRASQTLKNFYVGMDVIAGFPGESDDEFEDTRSFLEGMPWTRMHVFPYSIRPGTLAARRDDHLQSNLITKRAFELRKLSRQHFEGALAAQVGGVKRSLILEKPSHGANSLSRDYWPVAIGDLPLNLENQEVAVEVVGFKPSALKQEDGILLGKLI